MIKMLTRLAAASLGVAALAASPAAAGDTLTFRVPVSTSVPVSACGFPVVRQDTGTLIFVDRFDAVGNLLFENAVFSDWRITFTNPATGATVTSARGYVEQFVQHEDGSFLAMSAGLVAKLVVPGVGLVAANVGTIRVQFDATGAPIPGSIVVGGIHDGPIAQYVCPYLAG